MPGDKSPTRPEGGWKIHEKQLQEIYDWVKRERFLSGPGIIETPNGKRFMPRDYDRLPQFHPTIFYGNSSASGDSSESGYAASGISTETRLAIRLGYVFGPFSGGGSDQQLANIQQWVYEPKIGSTVLSADTPETLTLTKGTPNFIYLQINWKAESENVGGHTYSTSSQAFKAHHKLSAEAGTSGSADGHTHSVPAANVVDGNSVSGGPPEGGVLVPVLRKFYTIDEDNPPAFIVTTTALPAVETETRTYILAGYMRLNQNGVIESHADIDGFRWFLEGPVWARREALYISDYSDPDEDQPTAIAVGDGMEMPGSVLLSDD